jgi:hypothetical protein
MPVYELQSTEAALSVNLLKNKRGAKTAAAKNILAPFSTRSLWLFCNFFSGSCHTNERLEAA